MPRLNIYLPQDVYDLAGRWRDSANLSEICARAIREELDAAEAHRAVTNSLDAFRPPSSLESEVTERFGLAEVLIAATPTSAVALREELGGLAASYLDRNICDGSIVAIAGGRQMWCTVRNLSPRRVRTTITALGLHQADPKLLHAHPNTLTTLLWLLYSPRSEAQVVGAEMTKNPWTRPLRTQPHPSYFLLSSCSTFSQDSSLANLLGTRIVGSLTKRRVVGDFAYVFLDEEGHEIPVAFEGPQFTLDASQLVQLSERSDARIILVAGGHEKIAMIRGVLNARLCNMLVTDTETARGLL